MDLTERLRGHTPGPWLQWAGTNIIIRKHSGADRSEDLRICEVATNTRHDEGRHNIDLIAAAPDLLVELDRLSAELAQARQDAERLREALREIAYMGSDCAAAADPESFYRHQLHNCIGIAARAALAPEQI